MQTTITFYPVGTGSGYFIETSAGHRIRQDYAPGLPGETPMTEAEAEGYAQTDAAALITAMTPLDPAEPMPDPAA